MSDIRFNQWLHQSGTGGVSQVDGGHVGIGTTNPDIAVHSANAKKLNVGIVTANSIYAGNFYGNGSNLTGVGHVDKIIEGDTKVEVFDSGSQYISAEVNGSEKIRINSNGQLLVGSTGNSTGGIAEFSKSVGGGAGGCHISVENTSNNSVNNTSGIHLKTSTGTAKFFKYQANQTFIQSAASGASELLLQANGAHPMRLYAGDAERVRIEDTGEVYFYGNQTTAPEGDFGFRWDRNSVVNLQITNTNNTSVNAGGRITLKSNIGTFAGSYYNNGGFYLINSANGYFNYYSNSTLRVNINTNGDVFLNPDDANGIPTSNGNVGKRFGVKSTANNVIIGETTATSESTGLIFEARQTGRSGNARIAQINLGNDATADGRIKFHTAPDGADVQERFRISNNGVRSYATFVDTSYHANPDPFGDGSGIVYYRLNDNFHDSGMFAKHGTSSQGGDPTFALVNSTGEKCWNNPSDGAIRIPNLKNSYPFSMAAWVNISSWPTSSNNDLIMNLDIGNQRVSLCIVKWADRSTSDPSIMYGGTSHWVFPASSRPTNTWIHLVYSVVASNNSGHAVYQNGSALSAIDKGSNHGGSAGWAIGGNASNSERFAMGRIGSIRFFNKAISSSEASALYTNDKFFLAS